MNADVMALAPAVAPLAILAATWAAVIGPSSAAAARDAARLDELRARMAVSRPANLPEPEPAGGDPAAAFERRIESSDVTAELLGHLTRLALAAGVTSLSIDSTGAPVALAFGDGPRAADAAQTDARLALFGIPLQYSEIPMSFEARYAAAGGFLWSLRDLPLVFEIRSMRILPAGAAESDGSPARAGRVPGDDATVAVSLTLFAYARQAPAASASHERTAR